MIEHEIYMKRCLQLAKNGLGTTYPNPLVGSVIVHNGKIIGEGWHKKAGEPHAEVNAINSVKNKELLSESTIYVNLEPCSHFGKTPPCANLIIKHKIPKVVIGCMDTFSCHF
jgi:diaminohydroxyphosphoribosylaminopyrimidine deaminase/5-amino-6-(5-phosphoribosylamino)uracil reductase